MTTRSRIRAIFWGLMLAMLICILAFALRP